MEQTEPRALVSFRVGCCGRASVLTVKRRRIHISLHNGMPWGAGERVEWLARLPCFLTRRVTSMRRAASCNEKGRPREAAVHRHGRGSCCGGTPNASRAAFVRRQSAAMVHSSSGAGISGPCSVASCGVCSRWRRLQATSIADSQVATWPSCTAPRAAPTADRPPPLTEWIVFGQQPSLALWSADTAAVTAASARAEQP
jgi:hypothetical protein